MALNNYMNTSMGFLNNVPYMNGLADTSLASGLLDSKKLRGTGMANVNLNNTNNTDTGFGLEGLGSIAGILQGLGALGGAYSAYKGLGLAKDQFAFEKGLANRNLANQAKIINTGYDNAAQVAAGMIGGQDAQGNYGFTDQAIVDRYAQAAKDKYVDGSPIG